MPDTAAVPNPDPSRRAGWDFDPYSDQLTDIHTPWIPFHNYRQIHVGQCALKEGWNEGVIAKGIVPKIPDCPPLWQDVQHYWNFCGFVGTVAYELASNARFGIALIAVIYVKVSTGASLLDVARLIMTAFPL